MLGMAGAAAGHNGNLHRLGNRLGHFHVIAVLGAVSVHGSEDNPPPPHLSPAGAPAPRSHPVRPPPAVDMDFPPAGIRSEGTGDRGQGTGIRTWAIGPISTFRLLPR